MFLFHFYVESTKLMQKLVIKMIQLKSCQIFEITFGRGGGGVGVQSGVKCVSPTSSPKFCEFDTKFLNFNFHIFLSGSGKETYSVLRNITTINMELHPSYVAPNNDL